jgi:pimeloyl-ACP methyl ester carboxylesterase
MQQGDRVISIMATNTAASTLPTDEAAAVTDPNVEFPNVDITQTKQGQGLIATFRGLDWETIMAGARAGTRKHMYLNCMHKAVNPESAFAMFEASCANANPDNIADFIGAFYGDMDPQIAGLRSINCPCLMLEGQYDVQFVKPADQVAREVPNCQHVVLDDMGHMLAFENPQKLLDELLGFLGKAA